MGGDSDGEGEGWRGIGRNKVEQEVKRGGRAKDTETERNRGEEVGRTVRGREGGRRKEAERIG